MNDLIFKAEIETDIESKRGHQGGGGWEELRVWVWHVYTIDTMCKTDTWQGHVV